MRCFLTAIALAVLAFSAARTSQAQQVMKVGTGNGVGVPIAGINPQTKLVDGLAPDVIQAVAKDAGLRITFEPMLTGDFLSALVDKRIDIIAGAFSATPEREKVADFTQPFVSYRDVLIVQVTDAKNYRTAVDFKDMTLVVGRGGAYEDVLRQAGLNVMPVEAASQGLAYVEDGRAQGDIDNAPNSMALLKNNAHPQLKIVSTYTPFRVSQISFAVRKGNVDLLGKLNASLAKLKADGTINAIAAKWGVN